MTGFLSTSMSLRSSSIYQNIFCQILKINPFEVSTEKVCGKAMIYNFFPVCIIGCNVSVQYVCRVFSRSIFQYVMWL